MGLKLLRIERIVPAQVREAREVAVVGVNDRTVFQSRGGDGNVGDELSRCAGRNTEFLEQPPVTVTRIENLDVRQI